jgi:hypothetical protein
MDEHPELLKNNSFFEQYKKDSLKMTPEERGKYFL